MKFLMLVVADPSREGTEDPPITIEAVSYTHLTLPTNREV